MRSAKLVSPGVLLELRWLILQTGLAGVLNPLLGVDAMLLSASTMLAQAEVNVPIFLASADPGTLGANVLGVLK